MGHNVTVLYPGGATGVISIPDSKVDTDGTRFNIHLAGVLKLSTSSVSGGTFGLNIINGVPGSSPTQTLLSLYVNGVPINNNNVLYPFTASVAGVYDVQSGLITTTSSYRIGNASTLLGQQKPTMNGTTVFMRPTQLQFYLSYGFGGAQTMLTGTTLEITEFYV
jgi:hypothetical protein